MATTFISYATYFVVRFVLYSVVLQGLPLSCLIWLILMYLFVLLVFVVPLVATTFMPYVAYFVVGNQDTFK